jgi:hypothetical protein
MRTRGEKQGAGGRRDGRGTQGDGEAANNVYENEFADPTQRADAPYTTCGHTPQLCERSRIHFLMYCSASETTTYQRLSPCDLIMMIYVLVHIEYLK